MIKVLHCADIHLDTPFTLEDLRMAELRRQELRAAFVNMMMEARSSGVQLLLLAGDLFDGDSPTPETLETVRREFAACTAAGMKIFISPGNHDPYRPGGVWEKLTLPEGVHLFRESRLEKAELPEWGVCVYGYAFQAPTLLRCPFAGGVATDRSKINLLVGHGELFSSSSACCPITREEIARSGFDYLALGHIHKRSDLLREERPAGERKYEKDGVYYAYPGCLEGRDFGETGEKGALFCSMEKNAEGFSVSERFVRFSRRRYETLEFDVSGIPTPEALCERLRETFREKGYREDTLLRLYAVGEAAQALALSRSALHGVDTRVGYLELKDRTVPAVDERALAGDPTLRGAFYDCLRPLLAGEKGEEGREIAEMALRFGLAALSDRDITGAISGEGR